MGKTTRLKKWKHTNNRLIILQSHTTALTRWRRLLQERKENFTTIKDLDVCLLHGHSNTLKL